MDPKQGSCFAGPAAKTCTLLRDILTDSERLLPAGLPYVLSLYSTVERGCCPGHVAEHATCCLRLPHVICHGINGTTAHAHWALPDSAAQVRGRGAGPQQMRILIMQGPASSLRSGTVSGKNYRNIAFLNSQGSWRTFPCFQMRALSTGQ